MFIRNEEGKVKLYFTEASICIGSYDEVAKYEQETNKNYWASEYFEIPDNYDPIGKTVVEIQAVDRRLFLDKVMKFVKSPNN
ncbi:MAG: hypothetical protein KME29_08890 [Calothrix sp. FI2-JRJ7]|jgi:hypothetical protein|nr:hypothetical protein [Calothrix sp. FI2-JRJ7]